MADPDSVWRAAELLEDFKGQAKIKIQYEEAEVSPCGSVVM